MNRREFLRNAAVAGAAVVAAPLVVSAAAATAYEELPRGTYGQFRITTRAEDLRDDAIFGTGMPTISREQQLDYNEYMRRELEDYSRTLQIPNGTW
jgi:hypothetical protein